MPAHGPHQAAGAAADLERLPFAALALRNASQLHFEAVDDLGGSCEEFGVFLISAPECYVVTRVFASARVPILAHSGADFRIGHLLVGVLVELGVQVLGDLRPSGVTRD